jgi:hypothetical protein
MGGLIRLGASALLLLAIMFLGSLGLWIGVPLGWLWIAAQIQAATNSLGAGIGAAFVGVSATIVALTAVLSWLSGAYRRQRVARGLEDTGNLALEAVMVTSAIVALAVFGVWFFLLSGAAPLGVPPG